MAHGESNGHMTDDVGTVDCDLGMFGRVIGSLEKKSRHWTDSVFVRTLSCQC